MFVYFKGLFLGLSLIMALGPQNIFLIRQGALRRHAILTAITCFICDVILITSSVVGLQHIMELYPNLRGWITWVGVAFLAYYGTNTLKSSFTKNNPDAESEHQLLNRVQIVLFALGFSLLNPHAIIDSLVIIGGGSMQFPEHQKAFLLGVISSSFVWFSALTSLTYYFSHVLTREIVWKRIEFCSGLLMLYLSFKLLQSTV
jgi:L-lysine exporter family protein LysE/ArgO